MKNHKVMAGLVALAFAAPVVAQEHWTEGPVMQCDMYRTAPGMFDKYMEYIRTFNEPQMAESLKQGLIVDRRTFVKPPRSPDDWDVMFCTSVKSFADYDFSQSREDKVEAIAAAHLKTGDKAKQEEMLKHRLEMRRFLGTVTMREVDLKPMK